MVLLSDVRDYLKSFGLFNGCYVGRIDAGKQNVLGVYSLKTGRHKTIGANTQKYDAKGVSLLVHGSTSAKDTEILANEMYEALSASTGGTIAGKKIYIIDMQQDEPVNVGASESNIYEFVIEVIFYVEREE